MWRLGYSRHQLGVLNSDASSIHQLRNKGLDILLWRRRRGPVKGEYWTVGGVCWPDTRTVVILHNVLFTLVEKVECPRTERKFEDLEYFHEVRSDPVPARGTCHVSLLDEKSASQATTEAGRRGFV